MCVWGGGGGEMKERKKEGIEIGICPRLFIADVTF